MMLRGLLLPFHQILWRRASNLLNNRAEHQLLPYGSMKKCLQSYPSRLTLNMWVKRTADLLSEAFPTTWPYGEGPVGIDLRFV